MGSVNRYRSDKALSVFRGRSGVLWRSPPEPSPLLCAVQRRAYDGRENSQNGHNDKEFDKSEGPLHPPPGPPRSLMSGIAGSLGRIRLSPASWWVCQKYEQRQNEE